MLSFINSPWLRGILVLILILFLLALFFSEDVINFTLKYLLLYRYTTLFIIVFLGGLFVPIPTNILLMAIGALTIEGDFNFYTALIVGSLANLLGDLVAVLIFRKWGHAILRDQFVEKYSFFMRLEEFFSKHINISVFGSRIIGIFGTPVNFLAGYMKVSMARFAIVDYIGNFIFVLLFLSLGFWAGDRWIRISDFVSTALSIIAVVLLVSILTLLWKTRTKPLQI